MNTIKGLLILRTKYRSEYYKQFTSSQEAKRANIRRMLRLRIISAIIQDRLTIFRR